MEDDRLLTTAETAEFLSSLGYKMTTGSLRQYDHQKIGPPIAKYWGRRPLRRPADALEWAKARCRSPEPQAA